MKTIDTKSLLLGAILSILVLTLTSGKTSSDNNEIQIFTKELYTYIFNKQTNTIYQYGKTFKGLITETPEITYKVAADGSSVNIIK